MIKRRSQILCVWFLVWDLVLTSLAWVAAYIIRFETGWIPITKTPPDLASCLRILPLVTFLGAVSYHLTGQYVIGRLRRLREEVVCVVKGTALLSLLVMATTFYLHDAYESRLTMLIFSALVGGSILFARRITWAAVRHLRSHGYNQTHCVVVGTGRVARKTARALRRASWMGFKTIGFIEDQPNRWTSDLDILGTIGDLPGLITKYTISHVFIALPMSRYNDVRKAFDTLSQSLAEIHLVAVHEGR